ncbi:MAG: hypothetical protein OXD47_11950 [Gammaproteobacteria bacterium]|nr:hypothetical protein [Gammaproteobacteria bacterium]
MKRVRITELPTRLIRGKPPGELLAVLHAPCGVCSTSLFRVSVKQYFAMKQAQQAD